MSDTNPYTLMRRNVEYALEHHAGLQGLGTIAQRKWDDAHKQRVDNPASDRQRWIRVDTTGITWNPFSANGMVSSVQTLQVVTCLPSPAGKRLEDIEAMVWDINKALTAMCRDQMHTAVAGYQTMTFKGGDVALAESAQPKREEDLGDLVWSQVGVIEVSYEYLVTEFTS